MLGTFFTGAGHHHHHHHDMPAQLIDEHHRHGHLPQLFDWSVKTNETESQHSWSFPNPFEGWKEYAHWGRISFVDSNGA